MSLPAVTGMDLSLTATALAWPDRTVRTHGRDGLTNPHTPLQERGLAMMGLVGELGALVATRELPGVTDRVDWPVLVLLEGAIDTGTRVQAERCYVWWGLVNFLARTGVPVLDVPPGVLKKYACGLGNANKREVIAGVREWFPEWEIRRTGKRGNVLTTDDDNKADAVVLMAIGCELLGQPLVELPAKHRKALDTLELPPGVRL